MCVQLLTDVIATPPPEPATLKQWLPQLTPNTLQSVQVLQAVANVKGMVGDKAIGAYCISMAQSADDVFEVLFLGWLINRGLVLKTDDGWQVRLPSACLREQVCVFLKWHLANIVGGSPSSGGYWSEHYPLPRNALQFEVWVLLVWGGGLVLVSMDRATCTCRRCLRPFRIWRACRPPWTRYWPMPRTASW